MLFKEAWLAGIARGEVTVAFRRWRRPTVRAGGTLLTPVGVLAIDRVVEIEEGDISHDDIRRAGYDSAVALRRDLEGRRDGTLYRIDFRLAGPDPRVALRGQARLSEQELETVRARLARWDAASPTGPWTQEVLGLIAAYPATSAATLAGRARKDVQRFKANVRRLKGLGLTESLEVGYRLSARGQTVRERLNR